MALSNAERQALWRERRQAKLDSVERDWALFAKATGVLLRELRVQGRANMATMSPPTVSILTQTLQRLIERWPNEPLQTRKRLAAAKNSHAILHLLPVNEAGT
jgi:hypothetical protein